MSRADVEVLGTPEHAEAMWRGRTDAVNSLGRYLADNAEAHLAIYAVWEHGAGKKEPVREVVPPPYFGGPAFERLPEDVLLTIAAESTDNDNPHWDADSCRTHEWLVRQRGCKLPD